jgi:hypothetical protein
MAITEDDKIRSTPRSSKDPKSYEYARQMVYVLRTVWDRTRFDLKDWKKELEVARKNKIWCNHKPAYGSLEELLEKEIGYSEIQWQARIAEAEDDKDKQQGKRNDLLLGDSKKLDAGNTNGYLLRRLARDHEDIFTKVKSGALSVNQAAIQAGIRKRPSPEEAALKAFSKAQERLQVVRSILDALTDSERQVVKDWLSER